MQWLTGHLRDKLLAGALAAVPLVIIIWLAVFIEEQTRWVSERMLGGDRHFPGLGVLIVVVGLYLLGLAVTSLLGRFFLRLANWILDKVPGLNLLYRAWRDVLVVPPDRLGTFNQVVLVPSTAGQAGQLGFTSGRPLPGDARCICVLLPNIPNPLSGRLVIVQRDACVFLRLSMEEAFKFLFSTGNYLPVHLQGLAPGTVPGTVVTATPGMLPGSSDQSPPSITPNSTG
jgi:uncharacterized membrane protein